MRVLLCAAFVAASLSAIVIAPVPASADSAIEELRKTEVQTAEPPAVDPAPTAGTTQPRVSHRSNHHHGTRRIDRDD